MRVFLTGATGFIGSAIVQDLIAAGHQVLGLARSDASAKSLQGAGAQVHRGDLTDLQSLRSGAAESDGVIHNAFIHDFSKFQANCETDRRAIETIADVLASSNRPLVMTSGTALVPAGHLATEDTPPDSIGFAALRGASEQTAISLASRGVRTSIVRLPPTVHGDGDHGFIPHLIALAREKGESAYVGEGLNRWPAVHRLDAARLFRLALEKAPAGTRLHGVAEEGVPFREIAAVIAKRLGVPLISKSPDQAAGHFAWFAHFAAIDNPTSSAKTRRLLEWHPTHAALIPDLDRESYFKNVSKFQY